eukprot:CAMPEP_0203803654 /NCGR_PEP_ID=MMETSP0100_2-20121128/13011_1 /ASSEMBLY_ACC=CAM_ASM_000210 /TAXON_ID=96639 /ORGANISM=" , Strain NY0313808BC1" /LENGTH=647 /DNA_ID=CAMNT_0050711509 /DNA_START=416 /DNA_END=2355 /DNA_ORIENTATION=+
MAQRRPAFRARPIDSYKPLQAYNDYDSFKSIVEDEQVLEPVVAAPPVPEKRKKKSPAAECRTAPSTSPVASSVPGTLTEQLKVDSGTKGETEAKEFNLPVPETEKSSTFDKFVPNTFQPANAYIRHRLGHIDDYNFSGDVEYELGFDDEEWLANSKYGPKGNFPLSESMLEKMIDLLERKTAREFPISVAEGAQLFQKYLNLFPAKDNRVVEDVHNWWIQKRQKTRKPLLRRFWPITASNDSSPNLTFRPREKERYRLRKKRQNDVESYEKLLSLQNDFEMMKCLLELVRRRESLRQIEADLLQDEFEQSIWEIVRGPSAGPRKTKSGKPENIGPLEINIAPLETSQIDHIFEPVVRTPPGSGRAATPPGVLVADPQGVDISLIEADAAYAAEQRRRKKKKKRLNPEPSAGTGLLKKVSTISSVPSAIPPPAAQPPPKPQRPQNYVRSLENLPQYVSEEYENMLPIVPTWPPQHLNVAEYRRSRQQQQQQQQQTKKLLPYPHSFEQLQHVGQNRGPPRKSHMHHFTERQRYRCRGRIGRGGRFILDRIPIPTPVANQSSSITVEKYASPDPYECGQDFLDPSKPRSAFSSDLSYAAKPVVLTANQEAKLRSIYLQEDSEDEEVTILDYPYLAPLRMEPEEAVRLETW